MGRRWFKRLEHPRLIFAAVFLMGCLPALVLYRSVEDGRESEARILALQTASQISGGLRDHFRGAVTKTETVAAVLANQSQGERRKRLLELAPVIHLDDKLFELISLATIVQGSSREAFENQVLAGKKIRSWNPSGSAVSPSRPSYTVVSCIYPLAGNEEALGFDLSSEPVRAGALREAAVSGRVQCSDPIVAVQDARTDPSSRSTLIVAPTSGRGQTDGFVTALLRFRLLAESATSGARRGALLAEVLMNSGFESARVWHDGSLSADPALDTRIPITGDKYLLARFAGNPRKPIVPSYVLLLAGLLISLLVATAAAQYVKQVSLIEKHRRELQELAAELVGEGRDPS